MDDAASVTGIERLVQSLRPITVFLWVRSADLINIHRVSICALNCHSIVINNISRSRHRFLSSKTSN